MTGVIAALAAAAFAFFLLYHSKLDAQVRALAGGEAVDVAATAALLGGAVKLNLTGGLARGEQGTLKGRLTLNGKKTRPPVRKAQPKEARKGKNFPPAARDALIRYIDLRSLGFSLTLGVACDAAVTAKLCGLALTVLESAAGLVRILKPNARVLMRSAPSFNEDCVRARFSCIFSIKIGHIILIAAIAALELTKGAIAAWLTRLKASCVPPWKTSRT